MIRVENDVRNVIALCKNARWLFDKGLWTITNDYTVKVARGRFAEASPELTPLTEHHGRRLLLPSDPALYSDLAHLAWHRANRYVGGG